MRALCLDRSEMPTAREIIVAKGRDAVEMYRHERPLSTRFVSSLTKVMNQLGQEYGERFIFELLQNGHDAHRPDARDGVVHILLAQHGEHGVVYVANTGQPFSPENFHALCDVAQSDKPPGAGIGNKGVGFRSVLQVCRAPEIYSADADKPGIVQASTFGGFCFRFATNADYCGLSESDSGLCAAMQRDVSPYLLPVPADEPDDDVKNLAQAGMATVIRLPLDSEYARAVAEKRIEEIRGSTSPALLSLERIRRLVVEVEGADGCRHRTELGREVEPCHQASGPSGVTMERVVLVRRDAGADSTPLGTYLTISRQVEHKRLGAAIERSIAVGKLDRRFAEWREPAIVSIAVRLDADELHPLLYTYLPMETQSPLAAHLNAPFVPKVARTTLDETVPLNELLLQVAAETSAHAALELRDHSCDLTTEERDRAVVDLLSWRTEYLLKLTNAFTAMGLDLRQELLIPLEGPASAWAAISRVQDWRTPLRILNARQLAACGIPILRGTLWPKQYERLGAATAALGWALTPSPQRIAEWAETLAADLASRIFEPGVWEQLYEDLHQQFRWSGREALQGKKLLIDDTGSLQLCGPAHGNGTAVFFPPVEEHSALARIAIPDSLAGSVTFLNRQLQLRPEVRDFLQRADLVLRYDTRELIGHITNIAYADQDGRVQHDALRVVFELHSAAGSKAAMLEGVKLRVPSRGGWLPANEAFFSEQWDGTRGSLLQQLIQETAGISSELQNLEPRLLQPPTRDPFSSQRLKVWVEFLKQIGVRDGLWPEPIPLADSLSGSHVSPLPMGQALGLRGADLEMWQAANHAVASHPSTEYRAKTPFFRLPGQADYAQFGQYARRWYAELIVYGLALWGDQHLTVTIDVAYSKRKNPLDWMTPVAVFVCEAQWMPVVKELKEFVRPREAWHFRRTGREDFPHFFPLLQPELSESIDASRLSFDRLRRIGGLKAFNDPSDAGALLLRLADLVATGRVAEEHIRRFRQAYRRAWAALVEQPGISAFGQINAALVVSRGPELAATPVTDSGETIYVNDTNDPLTLALLKELKRPVLEVGESKVGKAALAILREPMGNRLRGVSSAQVNVLLDGEPAASVMESEPLLKPETRWLAELTGLALDLHTPGPADQADRDVQRRLEAVRIKWARSLAVTVDGEAAELHGPQQRLILIGEGSRPVLAIASDIARLDWEVLELMASTLARVIQRTAISHPLQVAIMKLARAAGTAMPSTPTDQELARALECGVEDVRRLRAEMRASIETVLERLRPALQYFAGEEAARTLESAMPELKSKDAVAAVLQDTAEHLPLPIEELLRACEELDLPDLRDKLGMDFRRFNVVLSQLGPPYRPYHYAQEHADAFDALKQNNRPRILAALKARFMPEFLAGGPLALYVKLRGLETLQPDPVWLDICIRPSDPMMEQRIDEWLAAAGAVCLAEPSAAPQDLEKLRPSNRHRVNELARECARPIAAWCRKHGAVCPIGWRSSNPGLALADTLNEAGVLDFCALENDQILQWMRRNGWWPDQMPVTTVLSELGLAPEDLREKSEADQARERRDRERRTIEYKGHRYGSGDVTALMNTVERSLSREFLTTGKAMTGLETPRRKPGPPGGGGGGGGRPETLRLTEEQRTLVGLVGEKAAFEWLKAQYAGTDESCWKSTNRDRALGGRQGNDTLGYDFEVFDGRGQRLFFEVKATTGEQTVIELGESEIRFAHKRARDERYRILFIPHVLDDARRTIYVLPNPLSDRGRACYVLTGTGMRYHFRLGDA
jgi:hypothetical protein